MGDKEVLERMFRCSQRSFKTFTTKRYRKQRKYASTFLPLVLPCFSSSDESLYSDNLENREFKKIGVYNYEDICKF